MIEKYIFSAKSWQIFLSLTLPWFIFSSLGDDWIILVLKYMVLPIPYFIWLLVLGRGLLGCIPKKIRPSENMFVINIFAIVIFWLVVVVFHTPGKPLYFNGVYTLVLLYIIFAFLYVNYFVSKALVYAEQNKRMGLSRYFGEMILFMFGLFGVWLLQSRINIVYEDNKELFLE